MDRGSSSCRYGGDGGPLAAGLIWALCRHGGAPSGRVWRMAPGTGWQTAVGHLSLRQRRAPAEAATPAALLRLVKVLPGQCVLHTGWRGCGQTIGDSRCRGAGSVCRRRSGQSGRMMTLTSYCRAKAAVASSIREPQVAAAVGTPVARLMMAARSRALMMSCSSTVTDASMTT